LQSPIIYNLLLIAAFKKFICFF